MCRQAGALRRRMKMSVPALNMTNIITTIPHPLTAGMFPPGRSQVAMFPSDESISKCPKKTNRASWPLVSVS